MISHYQWLSWSTHGWTKDDLIAVIGFIKGRIRQKRRFPESLRLHHLIDPSRFADDLIDCKAEARKPIVTPRQEALKSIGRAEPEPERVRTPDQIMRGSVALAELLKLRDSL